MAYSNNNSGSGLKFKTSSYNGRTTTSATMWMRETKKPNVYKYTVMKGNKTITYLLDLNTRTQDFGRGKVFPLKVLLGDRTPQNIIDIF